VAQPIKLRARIDRIEAHAPDLRSFTLRLERPAPRFRPGQFLHLAIDPFDPSQHWPESRVFSIASPPDDRSQLRITVSALGKFTKRMMDLAEGDEVWVKLPYGDFVIQPGEGGPVVLIAGGTGITPFISYLAGAAPASPVHVLYGARRSDLLIYRHVLEQAAERSSNLRWQAFVEENAGPGERSGRLSVAAAMEAAHASGAAPATYYISGPPVMLTAFRTGLFAAGVAQDRIRVDAWD
jgi:ferredoxin-NADP reductase